MHSIGFACQLVGLPLSLRTCTLARASDHLLKEIVENNLLYLEAMIDYCASNSIQLLRISSDIIPLASHPQVFYPWWEVFGAHLERIGKKAKEKEIRLSMHPGQYTVLNSPHENVVEKSILDLQFHCRFLDSLGLDESAKIIIHIGGVYGDREQAKNRFVQNFEKLPFFVQKRIIIENDDRCFAVDDVLDISQQLSLPIVFDVFHHSILPAKEGSESDWLDICAKTWTAKDGLQKIHYSQQLCGGKTGMHSKTIQLKEFLFWYSTLANRPLDIMLEVKDKNLSAVKCLLAVQESQGMQVQDKLLDEWNKYKYYILEKEQTIYNSVEKLVTNAQLKSLDFYSLCESTFELGTNKEQLIHTVSCIWEQFISVVTEKEKKDFAKHCANILSEKNSFTTIRNFLLKLTEKYQNKLLEKSLFFYDCY